MKKDNLKPCPFCGEETLLEIKSTEREDRKLCKFKAKVTCLRCFATVQNHGFDWTEDEAIENAVNAWNRRK